MALKGVLRMADIVWVTVPLAKLRPSVFLIEGDFDVVAVVGPAKFCADDSVLFLIFISVRLAAAVICRFNCLPTIV